MAIESGTVSDMLSRRDPEKSFFLSKAVIPELPDTRPRDQEKRDRVIALEIAMLEKKFDASKFPLAFR